MYASRKSLTLQFAVGTWAVPLGVVGELFHDSVGVSVKTTEDRRNDSWRSQRRGAKVFRNKRYLFGGVVDRSEAFSMRMPHATEGFGNVWSSVKIENERSDPRSRILRVEEKREPLETKSEVANA